MTRTIFGAGSLSRNGRRHRQGHSSKQGLEPGFAPKRLVPRFDGDPHEFVVVFRERAWIDAVASSLTELFAPDLMQKRIAAFQQHYRWIDASALAYFQGRLTQAPRDSQQGLRLVTAHCTTVETLRRKRVRLPRSHLSSNCSG